MRTLHPITQIAHEKKMLKMLRDGRFTAFSQIAREHHRLLQIKEEITMSDIPISDNDKEKANFYLRVICILSDIVEGTGIDLLELIQKYDKYVELPIVLLLKHLQQTAREINKIIDAVGNEQYSQSFGDVVDEVKPLILDAINELFNERRV